LAKGQRWNFSLQPILLISQSQPRLRHAHVTTERVLAFSAFREMQAPFCVILQQQVRLLHHQDLVAKHAISTVRYTM
jgi:hypothetical protein